MVSKRFFGYNFYEFKVYLWYCRSFHMRVVKHVALDEEFCRLYPQLYYNKSKQVN